GLAAQSMGRLHYLTHSASEAEAHPEVAARHGTQPLYDSGTPVDTDTHLTELFTDRAIDFLARGEESSEPSFCMVAYNAVHNFTWQLPEEELERHGLPDTLTSTPPWRSTWTGTTARSPRTSPTGAPTTSPSLR